MQRNTSDKKKDAKAIVPAQPYPRTLLKLILGHLSPERLDQAVREEEKEIADVARQLLEKFAKPPTVPHIIQTLFSIEDFFQVLPELISTLPKTAKFKSFDAVKLSAEQKLEITYAVTDDAGQFMLHW